MAETAAYLAAGLGAGVTITLLVEWLHMRMVLFQDRRQAEDRKLDRT